MLKSFLFCLLGLFTVEHMTAQRPLRLLFASEKEANLCQKIITLPDKAADSLEFIALLRGGLKAYQAAGYVAAEWTQIGQTPDSAFSARLVLGSLFEWQDLRPGNVPPTFLAAIGFQERFYTKKPFNLLETTKLQNKLLEYVEDNGFPFAQVWLDSIQISEGRLSAALMLEKGALFRFDTLNVVGLVKVSNAFLQNYLDIKKGSPFSRSKVLKISSRLAELPYLQERQKPITRFMQGDYASVNLLLDAKKASRWDFLVGVLPQQGSDGSQQFNITLNGTVDFQNALGLGERFYANFENLRPQSPRLNAKFIYPYILNLPFGFDGQFDLYKRDSAYIETHINVGGQYLLGGNDQIKLFFNNYVANNLTLDTLTIVRNRQLPPTLDVRTRTIGLGFARQKLDYRFNPRQGWQIVASIGGSQRQVVKNLTITQLRDKDNPNFNFSQLYDTVVLNSFPLRAELKAALFLPLRRRSTVKIELEAGGIFSKAALAQNEQYRIGGTKRLRGFDEEGIFATQFAILSLEYRFLLGQNTYLYAFTDGAYVDNTTVRQRQKDTPMGFGAGLTFETNVGLFGVSLALGRQQNTSIDPRNVKTHFGYISLF